MWTYPDSYDVIVMGGGPCRMRSSTSRCTHWRQTLLLSMNLDTIAKMSCNPAIGGTAKGHIVREIDALGGEMGKVTDATGIQFRMLNRSKGPAVWAPRAQAEKLPIAQEMKHRLRSTPNLDIKAGDDRRPDRRKRSNRRRTTKEGIRYTTNALVIISSGTFLRGLLHIGETNLAGGRGGDPSAVGMSATLERLGFKLGRLKTGTPPRIHRRSIDFTLTKSNPAMRMSAFPMMKPLPKPCRKSPAISPIPTHETKEIIQDNLHRSPMYSGNIKSVGPRYCPSIEDKIVRFADKDRHQIFLEPEGLHTEEVYTNGISSSLPLEVQYAFLRTIPALRKAEIMRAAYAIEYDYLLCGQMSASMECHTIEGLFFAGQINGTTGYEEAAAQGLMAGINAAHRVLGKEPFILKRSEAYIGVMIDDLITKGLDEPYRMFTSRAEHRLLLRQDNADLRLRPYGYQLGLINQAQLTRLEQKQQLIHHEIKRLAQHFTQLEGKGFSIAQLLCRPENNYQTILNDFPQIVQNHGEEINFQIELSLKYAGYIQRQNNDVQKLSQIENIRIPNEIDFKNIIGLSREAQDKLGRHRPENLGQASRISGVSPADIQVLMVALARKNR